MRNVSRDHGSWLSSFVTNDCILRKHKRLVVQHAASVCQSMRPESVRELALCLREVSMDVNCQVLRVLLERSNEALRQEAKQLQTLVSETSRVLAQESKRFAMENAQLRHEVDRLRRDVKTPQSASSNVYYVLLPLAMLVGAGAVVFGWFIGERLVGVVKPKS